MSRMVSLSSLRSRWMKLVRSCGLVGVHAGGGLIQQQQLGFGGQGARDLEPALQAIGQILGGHICIGAAQAHEFEQIQGLGMRLGFFLHGRLGVEDLAQQVGVQADMLADQHILDGGHIGEQANVLERAGDPQGRHLERLEPGDVMAVEDQLAGRDRIDAGHAVEEGGLAGAVRTDEAGDHAFFDDEIHVVDGGQAAERLGYFTGFEEIHGCVSYLLLAAALAARGSHGSRRCAPVDGLRPAFFELRFVQFHAALGIWQKALRAVRPS